MHPDIKTFSQVLGIKPRLEVSITVVKHGNLNCDVRFNNILCHEGLNIFNVGLEDNLTLSSVISEFEEGTSGVEITDFTVNGYNVIPTYQHLSISGNAYHDWIGRWEMAIPGPFYAWYHTASGQGWIA